MQRGDSIFRLRPERDYIRIHNTLGVDLQYFCRLIKIERNLLHKGGRP
jgi:hypothetical protein